MLDRFARFVIGFVCDRYFSLSSRSRHTADRHGPHWADAKVLPAGVFPTGGLSGKRFRWHPRRRNRSGGCSGETARYRDSSFDGRPFSGSRRNGPLLRLLRPLTEPGGSCRGIGCPWRLPRRSLPRSLAWTPCRPRTLLGREHVEAPAIENDFERAGEAASEDVVLYEVHVDPALLCLSSCVRDRRGRDIRGGHRKAALGERDGLRGWPRAFIEHAPRRESVTGERFFRIGIERGPLPRQFLDDVLLVELFPDRKSAGMNGAGRHERRTSRSITAPRWTPRWRNAWTPCAVMNQQKIAEVTGESLRREN